MWQKDHQIRWQHKWVTKKSDGIFTKNCDKYGDSQNVSPTLSPDWSQNKVNHQIDHQICHKILLSHQKEWWHCHQKLWQIWWLTKCVTNNVTRLITKYGESPNWSPNLSQNLSPNTLGLLYAKFATNASGATSINLQQMKIAPPGGKICKLCKWSHPVA